MKKIASILATALLLSACAGTGGSTSSSTASTTNSSLGGIAGTLGKSAVSWYVQNQCVTELQSRNEWRMIALAMSAEKQAEWEDKICGCVSTEAPNQLTAADLTQLASAEGRTKVMAEVGAKTVTACFKKLYSSAVN